MAMATQRIQQLFVNLILGYQRYISVALLPRCRFYPSCSSYAIQAIQRFGVVKGSWLSVKRLLRCQPFCSGGFDPVPSLSKE